MRIRLRRCVPFAAALLAAVGGVACGGSAGSGPTGPSEPVADQVFAPAEYQIASGVPAEKAQTFTVGITGHLVRIEILELRDTRSDQGTLLGDVRITQRGAPSESDSVTLASVSIPAAAISDVGGVYGIDLPAPGIPVTEGTVLAVVFRAADGGRFTISARGDNGYAKGAHYVRDFDVGVDTWTVLPGADIGFATYVEPGP